MRRYAGQKGVMLLELLVAAGITAMIAAVLSSTVFQLVGVSERGSDRLKALHDLENVAHWINLDGGRAEASDLTPGAQPVDAVTLSWTEGDEPHSVTYSFSGTNLQRNHNGKVSTVARYVSSVGFSLSDGLITVAMTSSPEGRWGISKDMTLKVWLRPTE